jgi:hypothetical protein
MREVLLRGRAEACDALRWKNITVVPVSPLRAIRGFSILVI